MYLPLGRTRKDVVRRLTYIQNDVCWLQLASGVSSRLLDLWAVFLSSLGIVCCVVALRCVVLCCVVLCCVVLCCVVLCCVALRCVALCCIALRCVVLCCVVLCCVVLCWRIFVFYGKKLSLKY